MPDEFTKKRIEQELKNVDINLNTISMQELYPALVDAGLIQQGRGMRNYKKSSYGSMKKPFSQQKSKSMATLLRESSLLDIGSAPFRNDSIKNLKIVVSSNEPPALFDLLCKSKIPDVQRTHLEVADIFIVDKRTGDALMIERKTITDLYQSVTQQAHAHDQCERMSVFVNNFRKDGKRARAAWIVESLPTGPHLMYESLDLIQSVDGLINYFDMINDQSVYQSFSMNHTAYLIAKLAQGFFEQKLYYSVKTSNPLVNRSKKERLASKDETSIPTDKDSGVTRHSSSDLQDMLSYLPGINKTGAANLAATGLSFVEIMNLSKQELSEIKGIGPKGLESLWQAIHASK